MMKMGIGAKLRKPENISDRDWGVVVAVLDGPLAWTRVDELPGATAALEAGGWLELWELADGTHATLSPWAEGELGVVMGERRRTAWRVVDAVAWKPSGDQVEFKRSVAETEESPRWCLRAEVERPLHLPRNRGYVELRLPGLVPARPEEAESNADLPEIPAAKVAELILLGQAVKPLKPRPRPGKRRNRRGKKSRARPV